MNYLKNSGKGKKAHATNDNVAYLLKNKKYCKVIHQEIQIIRDSQTFISSIIFWELWDCLDQKRISRI